MEIQPGLKHAKKQCFAYTENGCAALQAYNCKGCKFFKTKTQLAKEEKRTEERLAIKNNRG